MKKVLIITYYWPPAGGPGVQRVLKFAKYLPEFGWQPVILTVENGEYPAIDESLLNEIPNDIKVYKTKTLEPFFFYKKLTGSNENIPTHVLSKSKGEKLTQKLTRWIRANVFIPDARIGWKPYLVNEGKKIIKNEKPDLIFSSSPPHSLQIGAKKLVEKSGLKWVADFRDPWTDGFWQKELPRTNYALKKDLQYEKEVLSSADFVTTVSESIIQLFQNKIKNNYSAIPNGYDEIDFSGVIKTKPGKFRITYTGSLRLSQIPYKFFEALKDIKENQLAEKIKITFVGTMHPDAIELINKLGLNDFINIVNYMPHQDVINYTVNSEMLLLSIPNTKNNEGILTGKLFEYIGSKNFILGFGPQEGDAAKIINELKCGVMLDYSDDPKDLILTRYKEWSEGKDISSSLLNIEMYTRKNLTKKLVDIFESLI